MFDEVLKLDYTSIYARKNMRAAQIAAFKKRSPSAFSLAMQKFKKTFAAHKAKQLIQNGKGPEAMAIAETLLEIDPLDKDVQHSLEISQGDVLVHDQPFHL